MAVPSYYVPATALYAAGSRSPLIQLFFEQLAFLQLDLYLDF
jgi:hypothetical protein